MTRPTDRARRVSRVALAALLAAAGSGLQGCGAEAPPRRTATVAENLLARSADEVLADVGALLPTADGGFGAANAGGWAHRARHVAGERAVATVLSVATLSLPAGAPRDRTLELRARLAVADGERGSVRVALNGVELGAVALGDAFADVALEAPRAAWRRGTNALTIAVDAAGAGRTAPTLALARAGYRPAGPGAATTSGSPTAGAGSAARLELAAGDGRRYTLAGAAGGALRIGAADSEVDGAADGAAGGALRVVAEPQEARTGARSPAVVDELVEWADLASDGGVRLALPATLGPVAALELTWHADGGAPLALDRLTLERAVPSDRGPAPRPPLIVFLSVDTLAARHMSLYGYDRPTTPRLDAFAAEAIVFDHCTANSSWTVPSYVSQLTGLLPNASLADPDLVGGRPGSPWNRFQVAPARLTLTELLRAAGYRTVGIVDNRWLAQIRGVRQGFDRFDAEPATIAPTVAEGGMRLVFERARAALAAHDGERPLFLFLQVMDVHGPYLSRPPWSDAFRSSDPGPAVPVVGNHVQARGTVQRYLLEAHYPEDAPLPANVAVHGLRDAYDAKVLELDALVGAFVDGLRADGRLDRALFVLSADHGESTLHREFYFRHKSVYETTTHVPLVVRLPGGVGGGRRIAEGVQLLDLYPTLADLVGVDAAALGLHGRSLAAALAGEPLAPRPAVVETEFLGQRAVVHDGWKLVSTAPWNATALADVLTLPREWAAWSAAHPELARELAGDADPTAPPRYDAARFDAFERRHPDIRREVADFFRARGPRLELFDLAADPDEAIDRSADEPERVAGLLAALAAAERLSRAGQAEVWLETVAGDLGAEDRRHLIELGYLEPTPAAGDD